MIPATPLEAQRLARAVTCLDRARLENALRSICDAEGFTMAHAAVQTALQSLAADLLEQGDDLEGFYM